GILALVSTGRPAAPVAALAGNPPGGTAGREPGDAGPARGAARLGGAPPGLAADPAAPALAGPGLRGGQPAVSRPAGGRGGLADLPVRRDRLRLARGARAAAVRPGRAAGGRLRGRGACLAAAGALGETGSAVARRGSAGGAGRHRLDEELRPG